MVEPISQEHFSTLKRTVMLPNGLRLAYIEMGDPNGVPVLLLHGFTDSARSWSLAAPYLAAGFRVVAPDLRGHGNSDQPEGCYTIPELNADQHTSAGTGQIAHQAAGAADAFICRLEKISKTHAFKHFSASPGRARHDRLWQPIPSSSAQGN